MKLTHSTIPLVSGLAIVLISCPVRAASVTVSNLADDGGPGELRAAITAANATHDCVITFASGLSGTITLTSSLPAITSNMTIHGDGSNSITVDGKSNYLPFDIEAQGASVTISGLTIRNGASQDKAGAVYNAGGILSLDNCVFTSNSTGRDGGAVVNWNGTATMTDCVFSSNVGFYGGGAAENVAANDANATMTVTRCRFTSNHVSKAGQGGGIGNSNGTVTVTDSEFTSNNAYGGIGGGIYTNNGTLTVSNSTFLSNASTTGGAVGCDLSGDAGSAVLTITNCTLKLNTAANAGGGVGNDGGTATIDGCKFLSNSATALGGAMFNYAVNGHGSSVTLKGCDFISNQTQNGEGGAIDNHYGTSDIDDCTFTSNSSNGGAGGAIVNLSGAMTILRSYLASNSSADGGGIWNACNSYVGPAQLAISNSTLKSNTSTGVGGAISNSSSSQDVTQCKLVIKECIVSSDNRSGSGSAVANSGGLLTQN